MSDSILRDKVPPHNDDAEKATLGAVILDPEAISVVLRYLRPDDFYRAAHKKIYQAIIDLFNQGETLDLISLTDNLRTTKQLQLCGGTAYITALTSEVPTSANVEYYAKMVRDASVRRTLLRTAHEMISHAFDESMESRNVIEEAEKRIFEITDSDQRSSYRGAGEIVTETIDAIEKMFRTKDAYTGVPSGYSDIDDMTSGFQRSEFIIVGARPSVGKTAFALSMAANIAIHQKRAVGFFTLEMSDMALMQRLVSSEARIDSNRIRKGLLRPADFHSLTEAAGRIYEAPLFIDDTPNMKLLDLRAQARRMKAREKIEILFIDYITLVEPESKMQVPRHEQVAEISRSLKALARELEIPIVTLSQVGRQSEGKAPTLADLRESGSLEQDADLVIFLHRDRGEREDGSQRVDVETEVIVAKQRNGPVGMVKLAFLPEFTKFEALSNENS